MTETPEHGRRPFRRPLRRPSQRAAGRAQSQRLRQRAEVAAFKTAGILAPGMPEGVANAIARGICRVLQRRMRDRTFMVERHMRRALGAEADDAQVAAAVDAVFESYARYWVETFRLSGFSRERIEAIFNVDGREIFFKAMQEGGAILALPHLGQWEVAGAWVGLQGYQLTAVAEELEPEELFEWFLDLRERKFGMNILSANDPEVTEKLVKAIRRGDAVCLLADRDLSKHGPEVEFFGEKTTLPAGPANLAIETGVPLLPAAVYEIGGWRYRGVVRPPLEVPTLGDKAARVQWLTQQLAYELEGLIRRAPEQWHLVQPNWPSDREALEQRRSPRP